MVAALDDADAAIDRQAAIAGSGTQRNKWSNASLMPAQQWSLIEFACTPHLRNFMYVPKAADLQSRSPSLLETGRKWSTSLSRPSYLASRLASR